jgi:hypothetical protein
MIHPTSNGGRRGRNSRWELKAVSFRKANGILEGIILRARGSLMLKNACVTYFLFHVIVTLTTPRGLLDFHSIAPILGNNGSSFYDITTNIGSWQWGWGFSAG